MYLLRFCFGVNRAVTVSVAVLGLALLAVQGVVAEVVRTADAGFAIEHSLMLPVSPEVAYDVMTGDISGWWDHSFSDSPKAFYIEPKPGGGFYEIYDDSGDGVLHATVIVAQRGKMLRYTGPLGLSGSAITMVMTYHYEPKGEGTLVKVTVDASGNIEKGWDETVDGVWRHFLFERLKPYVESGRYLEKPGFESDY
ncbi:MAG: SRPBCC domain-containing protein [Candidatus Latescibacterota bacterium]|nr:MAG: SRPBCC domain-containing protein [Candidatus Latescibacterota bacterium]